MAHEQSCIQCEYDLKGLGRMGELVVCPECGTDNRIGEIPFEQIRPPMPVWWELSWRLGWPTGLGGVFLFASVMRDDPALIRGVLNVTLLLVGLAVLRGLWIALDCAKPGQRLWMILKAITIGLFASVTVAALAFALSWFVSWFGGEILKAM